MSGNTNTQQAATDKPEDLLKQANVLLAKADEHIKAQSDQIAQLNAQIAGQTKAASEKQASLKDLAPKVADLLIKQGFVAEQRRQNVVANIAGDDHVKTAQQLVQVLDRQMTAPIGKVAAAAQDDKTPANPMLAADNAQRERLGIDTVNA
jgi:uncharacterized coiled-coil protein SlyX